MFLVLLKMIIIKKIKNKRWTPLETKRNINILVIIHCLFVWLASLVNVLLGPSDKCIFDLAYISSNYLCEILF